MADASTIWWHSEGRGANTKPSSMAAIAAALVVASITVEQVMVGGSPVLMIPYSGDIDHEYASHPASFARTIATKVFSRMHVKSTVKRLEQQALARQHKGPRDDRGLVLQFAQNVAKAHKEAKALEGVLNNGMGRPPPASWQANFRERRKVRHELTDTIKTNITVSTTTPTARPSTIWPTVNPTRRPSYRAVPLHFHHKHHRYVCA